MLESDQEGEKNEDDENIVGKFRPYLAALSQILWQTEKYDPNKI